MLQHGNPYLTKALLVHGTKAGIGGSLPRCRIRLAGSLGRAVALADRRRVASRLPPGASLVQLCRLLPLLSYVRRALLCRLHLHTTHDQIWSNLGLNLR